MEGKKISDDGKRNAGHEEKYPKPGVALVVNPPVPPARFDIANNLTRDNSFVQIAE